MESKLFTGLYYTFFANGFTVLVLSSVMPLLMASYGINYETAGRLIALTSIGSLVATYCAGLLADRFGLKRSIVLLSAFVGLGYLGIILTSFLPLLFVFFLMIGVTRGSISNINNYIINNESNGKPKYLNYLHTFYAIGAFLSPLFIALIIKTTDSWKTSVAASLIIAFSLVAVYIYLPIPNYRETTVTETKTKNGGLYKKDSVFFLCCLILFFYVGTENAINGWLVTYLTDMGIVSSAFAQVMLSLMWLVMIAGRLLCAKISAKVSSTTIVLACTVGCLLTYLVFLFSKNMVVVTLAIVLVGLFLSPLYPTIISVCNIHLAGSAQAMGVFLSIGGIGKIVVPYVVGFIANKSNMQYGMVSIFISLLFTVVFSFLVEILSRRTNKNTTII